MAEDTDQATETTAEEATGQDTRTKEADDVIDLDSATDYAQSVEELQETVAQQNERIDELEDLLLDLSARAADDGGIGVCPECHGPVEKVSRWFGPTTIECRRCDNVLHEY